MSSRDVSRDTLEIPALGRQFALGTLYDAIKDETIPAITFWNESDLRNVKITRKEHTDFSIIVSDKLTEKFKELNVNGSLQISILSGMIKLKGSANYLNKKRSSSRQSSIHVKFKYRTAVKTLSMEQVDESNLRYQRDGRIGSTTHIITQIQYGAEAIFTFTKQISESEDEEVVNGQLRIAAEKLIKCFKGNTNVGGDRKDINKGNDNNIECHFQDDFQLPQNVQTPTTYEEAIEFAKKFIELLSDSMAKDVTDENQPLGVPIAVWLHPLVLLQDAHGTPTLRYEISLTLAFECVRIMQNYEDMGDRVHYMLEDQLVKKLRPFQKKLQLFQQYLTCFLTELKMKLGEMVVGIRSGNVTVDSFRQLLNRITDEEFTFNANRLDRWLKQKHKELCTIERFQDETKNKINNPGKVNLFPSSETLQQKMMKFPVEFGIEFSFSLVAHKETFLELLNSTLNKDFFNEDCKNQANDELWCEDNSIIEQIQKEIVVFAELVNEKCDDEKFAFAITAHEECNEIRASKFSIIVHQQQKKMFGWDAFQNVCKIYPIENLIDAFRFCYDYLDKMKSIDVVRFLIKEEEEITGHCQFPLPTLCRNLIDIVRWLLEKNIDVICKQNALLLVCRNYNKENFIDIVLLLIEKHIDVNYKHIDGCNVLHFLSVNNDKENLIDIIQLVLTGLKWDTDPCWTVRLKIED